MKKEFDFSGWATKADVLCTDGRVIMRNAFKDNDGQQVPLVWNHGHGDPQNILGHAILENRDEGVYAYCKFNDTQRGQLAKMLVQSGDINNLSIYANQLQQQGSAVKHGNIREVSLVTVGANKKACIDYVIKHGDISNDEALIYNDEELFIYHSDDKVEETKPQEEKLKEDPKKETEKDEDEDNSTIKDVLDTLTDTQKTVVYSLVGAALEASEDDSDTDDEEDDDVKHNDEGGNNNMKKSVFDKEETNKSEILCHADQETILAMAKSSSVGTFQTALEVYAEQNDLEHADAVASGFAQTGDGNVTMLFPEYKEVRPGAPELITSDQGWISRVMSKVHKSPISRIRTTQADIRNIDALKARGYKKGKKKEQTGNFKLVRRSTDPQTVYVKNALHRDDINDITDFDYVRYLYEIDRMMLNEELAMAIMLGDGRDDGDEGKIFPDHIRPVWLDDELYTIHVDLDIAKAKAELQGTNTGANFGDNYIYAEAMINTALYAREKYKGTGTPDFYCTPHMLNVMLLARDINGRRIYSSKAELASALNVGEIITAEQFEGKTRTTDDNKEKKLVGIILNLNDYALGATKGGEITHFTQFDIDFNQEKSLLETRCSGALTRVYSAIAIEQDITPVDNPVA